MSELPQHPPKSREEIIIGRLQRKLEQRDRKIAGLEQKVQQLSEALAWRTIDLECLSRNVRQEVQDALCNVRLIPVHGLAGAQQIVEVTTSSAESKLRRELRRLLARRDQDEAGDILDRLSKTIGE